MEELIRRVLQGVFQSFADGSEGTVTGGGTDKKDPKPDEKKEPEKERTLTNRSVGRFTT